MPITEAPNYTSWIKPVIQAVGEDFYLQMLNSSLSLTDGLFRGVKKNQRAGELLLFVALGHMLHWETLRRRNLVPASLKEPELTVKETNEPFMLAFWPEIHSIVVDIQSLAGWAALDLDSEVEAHNIFNNKPELTTPRIMYFEGGIEETDHAAKMRFPDSFVPGFMRSEKKYYASNHEYMGLGWQIYHERDFGMPKHIIREKEQLLHRVIRFRRERNIRIPPRERS